MEIRRLVVESEAAHPASRGAATVITFSGASLVKGERETPRLLRKPTNFKRYVVAHMKRQSYTIESYTIESYTVQACRCYCKFCLSIQYMRVSQYVQVY